MHGEATDVTAEEASVLRLTPSTNRSNAPLPVLVVLRMDTGHLYIVHEL